MNGPLKALKSLLPSRMWPQVPIGTLMICTGAANIVMGLKVQALSAAYQQAIAQVVPLSRMTAVADLGMLGNGLQAILGAGMLATGIALFWRLRSAWAFSILLLLAVLGVDLRTHLPTFNKMLPPLLSLLSLIAWRHRFERQSLAGAYLMSFLGLATAITYGVLGSLLLGGGFSPRIDDLTTALYFTIGTLSTAGSDIYPATTETKLFVVSLIIGGLSIFTTTLMTTLVPLLSERLKPAILKKKTES